MRTAEVIDAHPDLDRDDIQEALLFATEAVRECALPRAVKARPLSFCFVAVEGAVRTSSFRSS